MSSNPIPTTIRPGPTSSLVGTREVSLPAAAEVTKMPPEMTINLAPVAGRGRYSACGSAELRGWLVIGLGDDVCGFRLFPPPGFAA
jgi:hypothetical protein